MVVVLAMTAICVIGTELSARVQNALIAWLAAEGLAVEWVEGDAEAGAAGQEERHARRLGLQREGARRPGVGDARPVVVKKYANRRLYNTRTSSYITLDDIAGMVREENDFRVVDAKSGEDITHQVLTQIILEQESSGKGAQMLPVSFLRDLIGMYGNSLQSMVPGFLEASMASFRKNREELTAAWQQGLVPLTDIAEAQNIPAKFLTVILSEMSRAGLVVSQRGRDGGYELALPPVDISYGDIIRISRGSLALVPCASRFAHEKCKNCLEESNCRMRALMLKVRDETAAVLDRISEDSLRGHLYPSAPNEIRGGLPVSGACSITRLCAWVR